VPAGLRASGGAAGGRDRAGGAQRLGRAASADWRGLVQDKPGEAGRRRPRVARKPPEGPDWLHKAAPPRRWNTTALPPRGQAAGQPAPARERGPVQVRGAPKRPARSGAARPGDVQGEAKCSAAGDGVKPSPKSASAARSAAGAKASGMEARQGRDGRRPARCAAPQPGPQGRLNLYGFVFPSAPASMFGGNTGIRAASRKAWPSTA
jgi:hypothetical protein